MGESIDDRPRNVQDIMAKNLLDMAKDIFQHYNDNRRLEGKQVVYPEWEDAFDDVRYADIRQVATMSEKLAAIGCYIDLLGPDAIDAFDGEEHEILSKLEHDLWVEGRESHGWTYGEIRDDERHVSPYIAPWEQIPEGVKRFDRQAIDYIIPLLRKYGLGVYRKYSAIENFRYHDAPGIPLVISVTGHRDLTEDGVRAVREGIAALFEDLRHRYPHTNIILMTALAEGADREFAREALAHSVPVAPVFPTRLESYKETFSGDGFADGVAGSVEDVQSILDHPLTLSPCVLDYGNVNIIEGFRRLSAFLVGNSHILVAAWDGWCSKYSGGTYDTIRMACGGIDSDLIASVSPKSPVTGDSRSVSHYLNSGEDVLVYWIKVERAKKRSAEDYGDDSWRCIPDGSGFNGGKFLSEVDDFSERTVMEKVEDASSRLKSALSSIVARRVEYRSRLNESYKAEILHERYWSLEARMDRQCDEAFGKLDEINSDMASKIPAGSESANYDPGRFKHDGYGLLRSGDEATEKVRSSGCMADMAGRFSLISGLKEDYRRKSRRSMLILSSLSVIYTMLFSLMILFNTSTVITLAWILSFGIALLLAFIHARSDEHRLYVDYRALYESVRVEFFWGLAGVNDYVASNSLGYVKNGMTWMRVVMKGCASFFINDYSGCNKVPAEDRMATTKACWVEDAQKTVAREAERQWKASDKYSLGGSTLALVISALAVATGLIVLFFVNDFSGTLFEVEDVVNDSKIVVTSFTVLKLAMIALIAVSSAFTIKMGMFEVTSRGEARAASMLYDIADHKLAAQSKTSSRKVLAIKRGVLHDLGLAILKENDDWAREFSRKDYKRDRLFNAADRAKSGSRDSLDSLDNRTLIGGCRDEIPSTAPDHRRRTGRIPCSRCSRAFHEGFRHGAGAGRLPRDHRPSGHLVGDGSPVEGRLLARRLPLPPGRVQDADPQRE
jgi:hypothetical protein